MGFALKLIPGQIMHEMIENRNKKFS